LRHHLCSWSLTGASGTVTSIPFIGEKVTVLYPDGTLPAPGEWEFEKVIAFCDPLCFQPAEYFLEKLKAISIHEYCFDDDPQDLQAIKKQVQVIKDNLGWRLDPPTTLSDPLICSLLSRIAVEEGTANVCRGLVDTNHICGKHLPPQARGNYCKKHRHQNPQRKALSRAIRKTKKRKK
jgi:hypothetical protein